MTDRVDDSEILYRAVSDRPQYLERAEDGTIRFNSTAFADRARRPSVNRALLTNFNPQTTQRDASDCVVSVIAYDVRQIYEMRSDNKGDIIQTYVADVEPVPLPENPSHAEIFGRPEFDNDKVFRRICLSLVRASRIEIVP